MRLIKATLGRQKAPDDAYTTFASTSLLLRCLLVLAQPGSNLLTHPAWEALSYISTSTCLPCAWTCSRSHKRQISGHLTHWASRNEAQMHTTTIGGKHPVTGEYGCRSGSCLSTESSCTCSGSSFSLRASAWLVG